MKRLLWLPIFMALLLSCFSAAAQDEQYVRIYALIQEADAAYSSGQYRDALAKYRDAFQQLQGFQRSYPSWNNNIVRYRLSFLETVISDITTRHAATLGTTADPGGTNAAAAATVVVPAEVEAQVTALQNQIRQLQSENSSLDAKLREALRVQPAAADPRALERAEQQVRALQKENALLAVSATNRPPAPVIDTKAIDQLKQQLADANRKITEAAERETRIAAEREALQTKLDSMIPAGWNVTNIEATRKALEAANTRLAEQAEAASRFGLEKTALQERIRTLSSETEALSALRSENEVLKRQLAEAKAAPADAERLNRDLAEAKAEIAVLQSDRNVLRLENAALEQRTKVPPVTVTNVIAAVPANVEARVKELEVERDELAWKLQHAEKEIASMKSRGGSGRVEELQNEIQILRTRLAVMDMAKVPYTEAEEALIKKAEADVVSARSAAVPARNLPSGAMSLVSDAQKDFANRRFDKAEEKYKEVLKLDNNNVYTLANLAAIQIELNRYDEAEKHLQTALASAPEDPFSLSLLGFLRFRQARYDDALDVLGRAAKLDPQNAEIQNYLGLTLSQKGMRKPAEQALRKAIMIDPNYASAHYNLAVIYLAQQPAQLELARVHYRKATAAGMKPSVDMERMLNSVPVTR
ncbi:MAG TPA: tetratricopeptide repeat protein [Verrucomicrobiae bacterium]|nr:tetratricopeptide repeat protein [Verrucomicrobiae bacterium]